MQNESFPFRMHEAPQKEKDRDICPGLKPSFRASFRQTRRQKMIRKTWFSLAAGPASGCMRQTADCFGLHTGY